MKRTARLQVFRGGYVGNDVAPMLPTGHTRPDTITGDQLLNVQEMADREGILLPTEFNLRLDRRYESDDARGDEFLHRKKLTYG